MTFYATFSAQSASYHSRRALHRARGCAWPYICQTALRARAGVMFQVHPEGEQSILAQFTIEGCCFPAAIGLFDDQNVHSTAEVWCNICHSPQDGAASIHDATLNVSRMRLARARQAVCEQGPNCPNAHAHNILLIHGISIANFTLTACETRVEVRTLAGLGALSAVATPGPVAG